MMTALKLLANDKELIFVNGTKVIFTTPNNVKIDLSLVPYLISKNQKEIALN